MNGQAQDEAALYVHEETAFALRFHLSKSLMCHSASHITHLYKMLVAGWIPYLVYFREENVRVPFVYSDISNHIFLPLL